MAVAAAVSPPAARNAQGNTTPSTATALAPQPSNGSLAYVAAANSANYGAMAAADPRAIYLMQVRVGLTVSCPPIIRPVRHLHTAGGLPGTHSSGPPYNALPSLSSSACAHAGLALPRGLLDAGPHHGVPVRAAAGEPRGAFRTWPRRRQTGPLRPSLQDRFLVLDLNTEAGPTFQAYPNTTQWLWNALLVYGGRRGVYGSLNTVTTSPYADLAAHPNMVGLGITPEAIDQDMRDFDAFWEAAWRPTAPDATQWLQVGRGEQESTRHYECLSLGATLRSLQNYAVRRYGASSPSVSAAYAILQQAAFNSDIDTAVLEERPGLGARMGQNTNATGVLQVRREARGLCSVALARWLPRWQPCCCCTAGDSVDGGCCDERRSPVPRCAGPL